MSDQRVRLDEAAAFLRRGGAAPPRVGIILGSGLGALGEAIDGAARVPYGEVPHMPRSTVEGHAGRFVFGTLEGKAVVAMQGRFHYYEGYSFQEIVLPIRVMRDRARTSLKPWGSFPRRYTRS